MACIVIFGGSAEGNLASCEASIQDQAAGSTSLLREIMYGFMG